MKHFMKHVLNKPILNRRGEFTLFAGCLALLLSVPAAAHHSFAAAYDLEDAISITGEVVEVRLTNPHSHFFLDVPASDGSTVRWKFEAGTPSGMLRGGYSTKVIKPGDTVTINGFRARNESNNGMLRELVTADGKVFGMFGPTQSGGSQ